MRRYADIGWLSMLGSVTVAAWLLPCGTWAAGRAGRDVSAATSSPHDTAADEAWRSRADEGKRRFRQRDFAGAATLLEPLASQHPEDPWVELYLRMARARTQPPPAAAMPGSAILRTMDLPPVVIRPTELPPPPAPSEPAPAPAVTAVAPPPTAPPTEPGTPSLSEEPLVAAPDTLRPTAPEPELIESPVPYPQEIPAVPAGPLVTAPPADVPVQAHADVIEFSPELQRVIGHGHVRITHEDLVLTCDRIVVFTQSRDALALGHVRLVGPDEVLTGETAYYNFSTKKGALLHGGAEFFPWFSRAPHLIKTSKHTILAREGYLTTCDLVPPHYRFQAQRATVYFDDKLIGHDVIFYVGRVPLWYFPRWTHSLRENRNKFSFFPGKSKPWGAFLLGKYRYELSGDAKGTLHWDWRRNFGHAQGIDFKFRTHDFGYGLMRAYFNDDSNHKKLKEDLLKGQDQRRYRLLWRHRWDLDAATNLILDYQKYSDVDFRRDFLFREEFQTDTSPPSLLLLTRAQPGYTFTSLFKKRANRFQDITEALPEVRVDILEQQIANTRFYYDGDVAVANSNAKRSHSDNDTDVWFIDTLNQLKYAMKVLRYVNLTPRMSMQQTYFSKDKQGGSERPDGERDFLRGVFATGVQASTKLYRLFDVQTDLWGLQIRRLRHVITPSVNYTYTHEPTVPSGNLVTGGVERQNGIALELENKLQAKQLSEYDQLRNVDMVRFILGTSYTFHPEGAASRFSSITGDLELQPQPWLRLESDMAYDHRINDITTWNVDIAARGGQVVTGRPALEAMALREAAVEDIVTQKRPRWSVGLGHRYEREARAEMTGHIQFQPHPKWWFDVLGRFTYKDVAGSEKRINSTREFQVIITRDLHDWLMTLTVGEDRDLGGIFLVSFVLKAFPETPIMLEDSYHAPKQGSQASAFYQGTPFYALPTPTPSSP